MPPNSLFPHISGYSNIINWVAYAYNSYVLGENNAKAVYDIILSTRDLIVRKPGFRRSNLVYSGARSSWIKKPEHNGTGPLPSSSQRNYVARARWSSKCSLKAPRESVKRCLHPSLMRCGNTQNQQCPQPMTWLDVTLAGRFNCPCSLPLRGD